MLDPYLMRIRIEILRAKAARYTLQADEQEAILSQSQKGGGKSQPSISSAKRKAKSSADKCRT